MTYIPKRGEFVAALGKNGIVTEVLTSHKSTYIRLVSPDLIYRYPLGTDPTELILVDYSTKLSTLNEVCSEIDLLIEMSLDKIARLKEFKQEVINLTNSKEDA